MPIMVVGCEACAVWVVLEWGGGAVDKRARILSSISNNRTQTITQSRIQDWPLSP